jgi:hypothetical protein
MALQETYRDRFSLCTDGSIFCTTRQKDEAGHGNESEIRSINRKARTYAICSPADWKMNLKDKTFKCTETEGQEN